MAAEPRIRPVRHPLPEWLTADGKLVNIIGESTRQVAVRPVGAPEDGSADFNVPAGTLTKPDLP